MPDPRLLLTIVYATEYPDLSQQKYHLLKSYGDAGCHDGEIANMLS